MNQDDRSMFSIGRLASVRITSIALQIRSGGAANITSRAIGWGVSGGVGTQATTAAVIITVSARLRNMEYPLSDDIGAEGLQEQLGPLGALGVGRHQPLR